MVIPVFNVEKYIAKCLDSVVKQTLSAIEIIIINDCSQQQEEVIIAKYLSDPRVKYYKNTKNLGLGMSRNLGFAKAKGEYFIAIDSDDFIGLDMLEKMYNHAKKLDLDTCICDLATFEDDPAIELLNYKKSNIFKNLQHLKDKAFTFNDMDGEFFRMYVSACCRLIKADFFTKFIQYPATKYEDMLPFFVGTIKAQRLGLVDQAFYNYRLNRQDSITSKVYVEDGIGVMRELIEFFNKNNLFIQFRAEILLYISEFFSWWKPNKDLFFELKQLLEELEPNQLERELLADFYAEEQQFL